MSDLVRRLLGRVANGEEFIITEDGKPIARLIPAPSPKTKADIRRAIEELKAFSKGNTLGEGLTIREMIEEGRRS
jgi:antitoxin (DNA-binding transcriptional repressor) of toxin-antitoxin stability system